MGVVPFPQDVILRDPHTTADMAHQPKRRILPLEVRELSYTVGENRLLHDISFTVQPGWRTVVLGYNGAGKSLLLRLCHGLLPPSSGRILWHGPLGEDEAARRRAQAMVFQKPVMLRRSVRDNLLHVLKARGCRGMEARKKALEAMARCGIAHLAASPARALSGGEQQKLALARAWLLRPEILFLDEPTASLDPAATLEVERIIDDMYAAGTTIVFSTHDMAQARRLADRVLFLHRGQLIEDADASRFFHAPQTEVARNFLQGRLQP